ncbi:glutathione S-transferase family protein [Methylomicrobium sp. Wu6]|uniref:glutathione S-transferase family protein n=1 Tax=Methylomicrobium sp. Wu6 TaxID=3107928 RepID=UPI002DD64EFC|nr:glutathione S-transferase family protein [Methylomicrobium sp. Wu6]MEC4749324.1 glutathione S-transferase family protein [Methylomicrobium sp. Wu6]
MTVEVFWGLGSPYSWRVLLALELKRVPYQSRSLRFPEKDLKSTDFLAINPRGQLPAIRDGAFTLYESIAILSYLDAKQPERPLFGNSSAERGLIWRLIMECVYYLEPHMTSFAGTIFSGELPEKRQEAIESRKKVEQELARINEALSVGDYLSGNSISAADVAYYPVIQLLLVSARRENTEAVSGALRHIDVHFPALHAWCQRIEALPGFAKTNPPHWQA